MKLSQYAKQQGISYKTAWRWFKAGQLDAYQTQTGTVIVREPEHVISQVSRIALYARVSSVDQRAELDRQVERLKDYAVAKGYQISMIVSEIASGFNDQRPKLLKLLVDRSIGRIVVERRDRLAQLGYPYIEELLAAQDRHLEVIFPDDIGEESAGDAASALSCMVAHLYGRKYNKRRTEKIRLYVEQLLAAEDVHAAL